MSDAKTPIQPQPKLATSTGPNAGSARSWRVSWEIDIEAESAVAAAAQALLIMRDRDPANTAVVFGCIDPSGTSHVVDLLAEAETA
ncbi:hypothetical protein [Ruegeria sp.]|uniref:hypothetical protein n=1 Tax=Ruegeria sp. TaxID=1879320 RepID=UPI003B0068FF